MSSYSTKSDTKTEEANTDTPLDPSQTSGTDTPAPDETDQKLSEDGKDTSAAPPTDASVDNSGAGTPPPLSNDIPEGNASDPTAVVTTAKSTRTQDEGVQTGGLTYVSGTDEDGLEVRKYPEQKPVNVTEQPAEESKDSDTKE